MGFSAKQVWWSSSWGQQLKSNKPCEQHIAMLHLRLAHIHHPKKRVEIFIYLLGVTPQHIFATKKQSARNYKVKWYFYFYRTLNLLTPVWIYNVMKLLPQKAITFPIRLVLLHSVTYTSLFVWKLQQSCSRLHNWCNVANYWHFARTYTSLAVLGSFLIESTF